MRLPLEETLEPMAEPEVLEWHHPYLVYQPLTPEAVVAVGRLELLELVELAEAAMAAVRVLMELLELGELAEAAMAAVRVLMELLILVVEVEVGDGLLPKEPEEQVAQV